MNARYSEQGQRTLVKSQRYAEDLRARATPAERELCRIFDAAHIRYIFQANMCDMKTGTVYIADFRIRCLPAQRPKGMPRQEWRATRTHVIPNGKLFVEVDGSSHEGRAVYDAHRTRWIESHRGAVVLRFTNEDVFRRPEAILAAIEPYRPARGKKSATSAAS